MQCYKHIITILFVCFSFLANIQAQYYTIYGGVSDIQTSKGIDSLQVYLIITNINSDTVNIMNSYSDINGDFSFGIYHDPLVNNRYFVAVFDCNKQYFTRDVTPLDFNKYFNLFICNPKPEPIPIVCSDTSMCKGETARLYVKGGKKFIWSTGDTTPQIIVNPVVTTPYFVTIQNSYRFTIKTDTILVTVYPMPLPENQIQNISLSRWEDEVLQTSVNGDYYFKWNTGDTSSSKEIIADKDYIYTVTITTPNNCKQTISYQIKTIETPSYIIGGQVFANKFPIIEGHAILYKQKKNKQFIKLDSMYFDTLGYYYFYNVPTGAYTILIKNFMASTNGIYYPTYLGNTSNPNNSEIIEINQDIFNADITLNSPTSIEDVKKTTFTISPNPASNTLQIKSEKNTTLYIHNYSGELISTHQLSHTKQTLNLSELKNGVYFLTTKDSSISQLLLIQK